jgi:hypothetical protein
MRFVANYSESRTRSMRSPASMAAAVRIADPFLPEEEARLEWYFERALQALPSVHYLLEQT